MRVLLAGAIFLVSCSKPTYESYDQVCESPYGYDTESTPLDLEFPQSFTLVLSPVFDAVNVAEANKACELWSVATGGRVRCWAYQDADDEPDHDAVMLHRCPQPKWCGDICTYPSHALPEVVFAERAFVDRKSIAHELCHVLKLPDYYGDEASICKPVYRWMADAPTAYDVRQLEALWD